MQRPSLLVLAGSAGLALAAGLSVGAPAQAEQEPPVDPCTHTNYFPDEQMWEIGWGAQFYQQDNYFDKDSYGGIVSVNGGDVPAYMADADQWHWWYLTRDQLGQPGGAQVDLGFDDGTHWRGEALPDINGCPAVRWTLDPEDEPDPDPSPTGSLGSVVPDTLVGSIDVFGSLGTVPDPEDG